MHNGKNCLKFVELGVEGFKQGVGNLILKHKIIQGVGNFIKKYFSRSVKELNYNLKNFKGYEKLSRGGKS
jgi:hypothetical protein